MLSSLQLAANRLTWNVQLPSELAAALGWQPIALRIAALALTATGQSPERFLAELDADSGERVAAESKRECAG
jgi:hypothetical protein